MKTACLFCKEPLEESLGESIEETIQRHNCQGITDGFRRAVASVDVAELPDFLKRDNVVLLFSLSTDDLLSGCPEDDLYNGPF